jgi:hypothetical protein
LINARHIKNVPGKKTDILDCQWIQKSLEQMNLKLTEVVADITGVTGMTIIRAMSRPGMVHEHLVLPSDGSLIRERQQQE